MADCETCCLVSIWTMQGSRICDAVVPTQWAGPSCVLFLLSDIPRGGPSKVGWGHDPLSTHVHHPEAMPLWQGHTLPAERPTPLQKLGYPQFTGNSGTVPQWVNLCLVDNPYFFSFKPYYLPSLDATVDQRSLPLGYAWTGQEPDPLLACDREHCTAEENVPVQRLNCGHSFHKTVLKVQSLFFTYLNNFNLYSFCIVTGCSIASNFPSSQQR